MAVRQLAKIGGRCLATLVMLSIAAQVLSASELRRTAIVKAVEESRPSVVNIHGEKTLPSDAARPGETGRQVNGMGTGVVIDERGYILTNFHVVDGVKRIQVTTALRREIVAQLVAHDPQTDLAIIKVPRDESLKVIRFGTSSDLMPGEPVIAVGNAFGYNHTVTRGIISALHRDVPVSDTQKYFDLIQTDASINPGNSGGPLLNIDGEMIGLNVAVRVGAQGIGFAIPVDQALEVAARLLRNQSGGSAWHGVIGETRIAGTRTYFRVTAVETGSPAEKCGLKTGDVVTAVGSTEVVRALDFERALLGRNAGDELEVAATRTDSPVKLTMVMDDAPARRTRSVDEQAWETTGMRLAVIPPDEFQRYTSRYRGGLRVTAVRPGSPAAKQNVQPGDILVGMHVWETTSLENVGFVLARPEFDSQRPVKCYILRDDKTHYTYLPVSGRTQR